MTTVLASLADDIDEMYDVTFGFAESLTGPSGAFLAIWDNEYLQAAAGGEVVFESREPRFRCRDADALSQGDTVTRAGTDYSVVSVQPDGHGETVHYLHLA